MSPSPSTAPETPPPASSVPPVAEGLDLDPQRAQRWAQWRADNAPAIDAYNAHVREHGCFSDAFRRF